MVNRSQTAVSLERVFQRAALLLLAVYLVMGGGKVAGQVIAPLYPINIWLAVGGGLAWIVWRSLRRRPFPATPLDWPVLAGAIIGLVSALASVDPRVSLERYAYLLACVLLFYLIVDLERSGKSAEAWIGITLVAGTWFLFFGTADLVDWLSRWLAIGGVQNPIPPATIRINATLEHANYLASYLNLLWPLAAARIIITRSRLLKALLAGYILCALGLLYFTSSRGGWLSAAAALGVLTLLLILDHAEKVRQAWTWLRMRRWALAGLVIIGLAVAGVAGGLLIRQSQHPTHPTGNPRFYIWRVALEMARQRPLTGMGQGTYGSFFLREYSIPPGWLLTHAHNYWINLLGESGVPGLAAGIWLVIAGAWAGWKRWRSGTAGQRALLAGSIAALVGMAVHSQFDMPQGALLADALVVALLAQLAAPLVPTQRAAPHSPLKNTRQFQAGNVLLMLAWLSMAGIDLYSLRGFIPYNKGLSAAADKDWPTAAAWMDQAVSSDPYLSIYHTQAGLAHAVLGLDDSGQVIDAAELSIAVNEFERGLEMGSNYALDWARLARLREAAGDPAGSLEAMQRAVELAPEWSELKLAFGSLLEKDGQPEQASQVYRQALDLEPDLARQDRLPDSKLWREETAWVSYPLVALDDGWQDLTAGNYARAEAIFRDHPGINNAQSYLGLGLALSGQGDLEGALRALLTAQFIDGSLVEVQEGLAQVYTKMGRPMEAKQAEETAKNLEQMMESLGPGRTNERDYGWGLYHRELIKVEGMVGYMSWSGY